jgi:hypothetical protein
VAHLEPQLRGLRQPLGAAAAGGGAEAVCEAEQWRHVQRVAVAAEAARAIGRRLQPVRQAQLLLERGPGDGLPRLPGHEGAGFSCLLNGWGSRWHRGMLHPGGRRGPQVRWGGEAADAAMWVSVQSGAAAARGYQVADSGGCQCGVMQRGNR